MKQNKTSGFWIRLLSRFLDLALFSVLSISLAYLFVTKNTKNFGFVSPLLFYVWNVTSILLLFAIFVLMPISTSGQTPAMLLLRIKIVFENKTKQLEAQIKRELFFSLAWIFNLLMLLTVINHSLVNKVLIRTQNTNYSTLESIRVALFTTTSSILFLVQWIFTFSIMVRTGKVGFHDQMSKTKTVYKNKFETIYKSHQIKCFKPFMIKNKTVEWVQNV